MTDCYLQLGASEFLAYLLMAVSEWIEFYNLSIEIN